MQNERKAGRGRVVVGVDGEKGSTAVLQRAAEEARRRDATLVAVMVWSPFGGEYVERMFPCPELSASQEALAREILDTQCERASLPNDVPVEHRVAKGVPGPVLTSLARGAEDLLVVGRKRRQVLRRLRRTVDKYCLQHAASRVLVVTAP
ncbi:universal stress protein [Streptomyces sp. NPDC097610]|uniref:universal stress protein n=1 Tax=Streptomyces sp. NPDC097610 TaxID=3157227 RepID=UPI003324F381